MRIVCDINKFAQNASVPYLYQIDGYEMRKAADVDVAPDPYFWFVPQARVSPQWGNVGVRMDSRILPNGEKLREQ